MSAADALAGDIAAGLTELCRAHLTPEYLQECDQQERFPREAMDALAAAGYAGMGVAPEFGGIGSTAVELVVAHAVLARHSLAVAQAFYSLWVLGADAIGRLGTPEQKAEWLPRIASGSAMVAFALTEPDSGSDASALRTHARGEGDHYTLNGQKLFITGAGVADVIVTAVRTDREARPRDGLSLLLVDPASPGVRIQKLSKIGLRSLDLCEVFFDEAPVPAFSMLGTEGAGWASMRPGLAAERTYLAAICCGALEDLVNLCTAHASERKAFGQPIGRFQMIGQKIVDMRVSEAAARLLTVEAARTMDAGLAATVPAAIAKLFASEAYVGATRQASQVFGGYGFMTENPVGRHYRDAKYLEIGGGTSEIQRLIIGRDMGLM